MDKYHLLPFVTIMLCVACSAGDPVAPVAPESPQPPKRPLIAGTNTQVVRVALDGRGQPVVERDPVFALPGDTLVFAGPPHFSVHLPEASPWGAHTYRSEKGALALEVPYRAFDRSGFYDSILTIPESELGTSSDAAVRVYPLEVEVDEASLDLRLVLPAPVQTRE